jgi:hypothetical protein
MRTFLPVALIVAMLFIQPSDAFFPKLPPTPAPVQRVEVNDSFKSSLVKAIQAARQSDKITAKEALKLRIACMSPAFVERAHELAVVQIAFSGEESSSVPMSADGVVQVASINWEGLAKFMEVFIPLLITLLKAFGI